MARQVLLVGAQLDATGRQLDEIRERLEAELPSYRIVVVAGMAGTALVEERRPVRPFVEFADPVASIW